MSNLLEQSSILLSPTAYNNGSMLAVKPENGDGDFTFSRNSAATRVNAQGLVENVQILSSDLVSNGDFSNGSTDWNLGTNFSIADGKLKSINTANAAITNQSAFVFTIGKSYKLTFDISDYVEGNVRIWFGGFNSGNFNSNGTFSVIGVANRVDEILIQSIGSNNTYSLDNVSVKEYTTATNTPRLDYSTGSEAFLLEPQSTNLITYSEDFSQSVWAKGRVSITPNTLKSPDGSINASTLSVTSATGGEEYLRIQSNNANEATCSFYVKKGNWRYITIRSVNASVFDFDTEAFTFTGTNEIVSFDKLQNGWYRLKASSPTRIYCSIGFATNATTPYGGSGVNGSNMYIWGAQLEQQSYATSYIPTSGASATRNQELCTNATPVINSEEGTLYAEISALSDDLTNRLITISNGTTNNRLIIQYNSQSNNISCNMVVGGSARGVISYTTAIGLISLNKIAVRYSSTNFDLYVNGVLRDSVGAGSVMVANTMNELQFANYNGTLPFFGNTKGLKYYPKALADVQLQDLTTL